MTSMRERILAELATRLETPPVGVTKPAGLAVHRFAMVPVEDDQLPAAVVYWTACDQAGKTFLAATAADRLLEYHLSVRVEVRASGATDAVLEPLIQYVRQVVFTDPSLGGLATAAREDGLQLDAIAKSRILWAAAVELVFSFLEEPLEWPGEDSPGILARVDFPTHPTEQTLTVPTP